MRFTLARRVFIAILLFDVALIWRAFHIDLKSRREAFAVLVFNENASEYGLTISGHVTVLRQWLSEKNTDYIIKHFVLSLRSFPSCYSLFTRIEPL